MAWNTIAVLETTRLDDDQIRSEDGGCAKIAEVYGDHPRLWCAVTSYIDAEQLPEMTDLADHDAFDAWLRTAHPEIDRMRGKRVRITLEVGE